MITHAETEASPNSELALEVTALAARQGIVIPPACIAEVASNLEILWMHMEIVRTAAADAPSDPAEFLAP